MKLLRPKILLWLLFFLVLGAYLFLAGSYLQSLIRYRSLSRSGVTYSLKGRSEIEEEATYLKPASTRFGLVITKLGLNSKVVKNIDFYDPAKLKSSLRRGLVHVEASALPGEFGSVLIVGHPLGDFFNLDHLNPDFYLIGKLAVGDEISLFYNDLEYRYQVTQKKYVDPSFLDFFDPGETRKLMLVSGYPPGMALRFVAVEADEVY